MKYLKKYNEILQYYSDIDKINRQIKSKREEYKDKINKDSYDDLVDLINRSIDMLRHELQAEISMVSFYTEDNENMKFGLNILDKLSGIHKLKSNIVDISICFK